MRDEVQALTMKIYEALIPVLNGEKEALPEELMLEEVIQALVGASYFAIVPQIEQSHLELDRVTGTFSAALEIAHLATETYFETQQRRN